MVLTRFQCYALSWFQDNLSACRNRYITTVYTYSNRRICKSTWFSSSSTFYIFEIFFGTVVQGNCKITSASVDDVFHFTPVIMIWKNLSITYKKKFFCVWLRIFIFLIEVSVSECKDCKTNLLKITTSEICDIPSEHIFYDLFVLFASRFPFRNTPICEWWKRQSPIFHKFDSILDYGI